MLSQYGMRSFHVSYASLAKVCCERYHVCHHRVLFKEKATEPVVFWQSCSTGLLHYTAKDACDEKRVSLNYLCLVAHTILISKVLFFCFAEVPIRAIWWCSYLVTWLHEVTDSILGYSEVHSNKRSTQCHGRCIEGIWIAFVTFSSYITYICWLVICVPFCCKIAMAILALPFKSDVANGRFWSQTGCVKLQVVTSYSHVTEEEAHVFRLQKLCLENKVYSYLSNTICDDLLAFKLYGTCRSLTQIHVNVSIN